MTTLTIGAAPLTLAQLRASLDAPATVSLSPRAWTAVDARRRRGRRHRGRGPHRLWRQHRLRPAGQHQHRDRRPRDAAEEPRPQPRLRRRRPAARRRHPPADGAEDRQPVERRLGHPPRDARGPDRPRQRRRPALHSVQGLGRRLGRPRAAGPHVLRPDRRRRGPPQRRDPVRRGRPRPRWPHATGPRPQGRPRPAQRHPVLDRPRPRRPVRRRGRLRRRDRRRGPVGRCAQGLRRPVRRPHPRPARPARPDRRRRPPARPDGRLGHPNSHREGCHKVQDPYSLRCQPQVMGAVLDVLRNAAATLRARGQRRHRQSAGLHRGGRRHLGRQLPRRTRCFRG
jgi:hypothetical protein